MRMGGRKSRIRIHNHESIDAVLKGFPFLFRMKFNQNLTTKLDTKCSHLDYISSQFNLNLNDECNRKANESNFLD